MPPRAPTWFAPPPPCPPESAAAPPSTPEDSNTVTGRPSNAAPTAVASPDKPPPATTTRGSPTAPSSVPVIWVLPPHQHGRHLDESGASLQPPCGVLGSPGRLPRTPPERGGM